jgi:hypothetical protein
VNYTVSSGTVVSFSYADPPLDPALQDQDLQAPYGIVLCADDADGGGNEN